MGRSMWAAGCLGVFLRDVFQLAITHLGSSQHEVEEFTAWYFCAARELVVGEETNVGLLIIE